MYRTEASSAAFTGPVTKTTDGIGLKLLPTHVDIADIRRKYHTEAVEQKVERHIGQSKTGRRHD